MPRQKLLFLCKDACNCDLGRANIDRLFYKWNHTSIPELSGYSSRGMASFSFWTNLVQNRHISGLLHSLLQWKKEKLLQWVRGWGGKGEGAPARRQADFWLYLLVCFFFLAYQPQKSKNITTAPTKESRRSFRSATGRLQAALPGKWGHDRSYLRRRWGLPSRAEPAVHQYWPDQSTLEVNDQFICETCATCLRVVYFPTRKWDTPWIEKK